MIIGTLAFHYAYNYGAVLQSVGLYRALRDLGVDARVIDYRSPAHYVDRLHTRHPFRIVRARRADRAFKSFRESMLKLSPPLSNPESLINLSREYDGLIAGSDQVWNLHKTPEPAFFLDYPLHEGCRRLAYAACFGQEDSPPDRIKQVAPAIERFDEITVRNATSQRVLLRDFNRHAEVAADPTLLVDLSDLAESRLVNSAYIYAFSTTTSNRPIVEQAVVSMRSIDNTQVVTSAMTWAPRGAHRVISGAGPRQWLSLVRHAKFMVTDSFHGMVFAIKHRVPFAVCYGGSTSGRMADLLACLGISGRISSDPSPAWISELLETVPDWDQVHHRIVNLRQRSLQLLANMLST